MTIGELKAALALAQTLDQLPDDAEVLAEGGLDEDDILSVSSVRSAQWVGGGWALVMCTAEIPIPAPE